MNLTIRGLKAPLSLCDLAPVFSCTVGVLFLALSAKAWAQTEATPTLPPLTITASRMPMRVEQAVAEVTVIQRDEIDRSAGRSLPELLAQQAGLQLSAYGGLGKAASVNIRGLESRHTLLMIDGVRYGSATLGQPVFDNIALDAIERIEIVRGPLSSLYGSDAVAGVVQIFTRKGAAPFQAHGSVTVGSHWHFQQSAGLGMAQGPWDGAVQVAHLESKGFSTTNPRVPYGSFNADNDGFRQHSGSAQLGLKLGGDWRLGATTLQVRGVTDIDDGPGPQARTRLRSEVTALDLSGSARPGWRTVMRASQSVNKSVALSTASPYIDLGAFVTRQRQLSREDSFDTSIGQMIFLADFLQQQVSKPAEQYPVRSRNLYGVAAALSGQHEVHTWQASVRHDRNSQFGKEDTAALGYGLDLTPHWRLGASYGTSFVAPSFNQLYYPQYGNADLQPEHGVSSELSLRYKWAAHQLRAALFQSRIHDFISAGPNAVNVPTAQIEGVSISYGGRVHDWATALSLDHVSPRNESEQYAGKRLPRRAANSFKADLDRDVGAYTFGMSLQAFGHRFDDASNQLRVGGYARLDVRSEWRFARHWALQANMNNLTDQRYETVSGYNQPGREVYLTLRYAQR